MAVIKDNTSDFQRIYDIVCQIPYGRVTSYGAIARCIGSLRGARLVGWAINQSHKQKKYIPAHRVVNRNGLLTGKHHFGGESVMRELLENEGVIVIDDQIQNFQDIFWDPSEKMLNFFD